VNERFVVVPASYVYLTRGAGPADGPIGPATEVLLQLRQNTGYRDGFWAAAAAGHVERGEDAFAAARREAREEIGVDDLELTFLTTMQRTQGADPIDERVDFFFTAAAWSGEPTILEPRKCAELRWCRLDGLPDPVVPHERVMLGHLASGRIAAYVSLGFANEREIHA
jgi:8-oxo-dGTP pyrophosphatase MutT (NUDIX family)